MNSRLPAEALLLVIYISQSTLLMMIDSRCEVAGDLPAVPEYQL